jgi:predicted DNA-binding transcriptional regulator YafY
MRATRLVSLLLLLQVHGRLTAAELAERLDVSVRSIYRDIHALAEAGVPVVADRGPAGGYRLREGYRSRLPLTEGEVEALLIGPAPSADLGLGAFVAAGRLKLLASLPADLRERAARAERLFYLDVPQWFSRRDNLPYLMELAGAVWEDRRLEADYRDRRGEHVTRILDPYGLVLKAGHWYLVARADDEVRIYRCSRLRKVIVLDERFSRPRDFELERFWLDRVAEFESTRPQVEVAVRVDRENFAKLRAGLDWSVRPAVDAAGESGPADGPLTLVLPFESIEHAYPELVALGGAVEVISPPELRERLAGVGKELVDVYYTDAGEVPATRL